MPRNPAQVARMGYRSYPSKMILRPVQMDFGSLTGAESCVVLRSIHSVEDSTLKLEVNVASKKLIAYFPMSVLDDGYRRHTKQFKLVADISLIKTSYTTGGQKTRALIFPLSSPPQYFEKESNDLSSLSSDIKTWSVRETWWRSTDISAYPGELISQPVALHCNVSDPSYVDIGRWTTIAFILPYETPEEVTSFSHVTEALEDLNIKVISDVFAVDFDEKKEPLWDYLDQQPISTKGNAADLLTSSLRAVISLPFEVRYQLEVCVSRGLLAEYGIPVEFLEKLAAMDSMRARLRLEYVADRDERVHDPMSLFTNPEAGAYLPHRPPHYCAMLRKAVITPTTIRFSSATVEASNRVIRKFKHVSDRFLRVQFTEEGETGRISAVLPQSDKVWERVRRALFHGIRIGDRVYQFLAFGSSQMRQSGAYFFCPTSHISCDDIRNWMGQFKHIRVVAKYAARLGQCLSTTREIRGISIPTIRPISDIEANGYCFTDGVGIVSNFLRHMIIEEMALDVFDEPSAFQFRMGGCKGVLAVWPQAKGLEVQVRQSQEKFKANFDGLEIIKCAKFATATLNRQTITILECLGVPAKAFEKLLDQQLRAYQMAMTDNNAAISLLTRFVDENQTSLVIAELLKADFKTDELQEPFVLNVLSLWRSWSLKLLKEKARIQVEKSAFVLGCVDETGTLRGHSTATEGLPTKNIHDLPQIFLQLTDPRNYEKARIITGVCIVGRNPSLHPGDIRVVEAVDSDKLRHLKDVVVFPSTGDRPVPNMLSGGDLDGDDFFVIWEPSLIPAKWNHAPMDYEGTKPEELDRDVNVDDLKHFFVRYLRSDVLPLIAISHLAFADQYGPESPLCLELAHRHSQAVDFPKTGEAAAWDVKLMPERWPHFMEKRQSYRSQKSLGIIYDKVAKEPMSFHPDWEHAFDQRVLARYEVNDHILQAARDIKAQHDMAVARILTQHGLATEFELWTTFAMSRPAIGSDYKRQEDLGREYDSLKQRFREMCYSAAGGSGSERLDPFVVAMYKVTEEETLLAIRDRHKELTQEGQGVSFTGMPLISFPWIFHWVMIRLATGRKYDSKKSMLAVARRALPSAPTLSQKPEDQISNVDSNVTKAAERAEEVATKLPDGTVVQRGQPLIIFNGDDDMPSGGLQATHREEQSNRDDQIQQRDDTAKENKPASQTETESVMDRLAKLIDWDDE